MKETVREAIERSGDWLLGHQHPTGGWGDLPGKPPSTLNTAEVLIALLRAGSMKSGDKPIRDGVKFLLLYQVGADADADAGCWTRIATGDDGIPKAVPDLLRTCFAIEALVAAGADDARIDLAVAWVLGRRNADTGWAFAAGRPSAVMPTCFALMALLVVYRAGRKDIGPAIVAGIDLLVGKHRNDSGSFGGGGRYESIETIYAALVLEDARRCKLGSYAAEEERALDWLMENRAVASKLVEGTIDIDPDGDADYSFLYMSDALVIRALADSQWDRHRASDTAKAAMITLGNKLDESGGCFGERIFSWSTSKAMFALCTARDEFQVFPVLAPEPRDEAEATAAQIPPKVAAPALLAFAVLVLIAAVVLALNDKLGIFAAILMFVLLLTSLLAYGRITEATFERLAVRNPFKTIE